MRYTIHRTDAPPSLTGDWDGPTWSSAETLEVAHYHPKSSDHRPRTFAKLLYDDRGLYVIFRVLDRYVRCVHDRHQTHTYQDSCVECFLQPTSDSGAGYFNFEVNCGGAMLLYFIEEPTPQGPTNFARHEVLPPALLNTMGIYHSMPKRVPEEIAEPTEWRVEWSVPWGLFERYVGGIDPREMPGKTWRGNFYKCGDDTSHPHWGAWAPVGERLSFHQPGRFGELVFTP